MTISSPVSVTLGGDFNRATFRLTNSFLAACAFPHLLDRR
jgi:hypothetical protein